MSLLLEASPRWYKYHLADHSGPGLLSVSCDGDDAAGLACPPRYGLRDVLNVGRRHRAQIRRFGSIDDRTRLLQLRGREPPLPLDARFQPRRDLAPSVRAGDGGGSSCLLAGIPRRPRQPCVVEPTACQRCFDSVRWSCPRIRGWRSMACNSPGFGCAGRAKATRRSQRSTALGSCLGGLSTRASISCPSVPEVALPCSTRRSR